MLKWEVAEVWLSCHSTLAPWGYSRLLVRQGELIFIERPSSEKNRNINPEIRVEMDHSRLDELSAPGVANTGLPFSCLLFVEFQVLLQSLECLQRREPGCVDGGVNM